MSTTVAAEELRLDRIAVARAEGEGMHPYEPGTSALVRWFEEIDRHDVPTVGGKGANLGEMTRAGLPVPPGFVLPVDAWRRFVAATGIGAELARELAGVSPHDPERLAAASARLRAIVERAGMPDDVAAALRDAHARLAQRRPGTALRVAVRSSALGEDAAQHSFAGMFESFLGVASVDDLLRKVRACWASAFHARALFYRLTQGLPADMPVAVVVQAMVASDKSGVMFTADPATRDTSRIVIEAAWGLGEVVVLGQVRPDRHVLDKASFASVSREVGHKTFMLEMHGEALARVELEGTPKADAAVLSDGEVKQLAEFARAAEAHYGTPQDLEFAIEHGTVWMTQARPITTLGAPARPAARRDVVHETALVRGLGASPGVVVGRVRVLGSPADAARLQPGEVLVTRQTSPDWVPILRRAAAVVTDEGGMTSHAAIVSRELGIPCIVGTGSATRALHDGAVVLVDGHVGSVIAAQEAALAQQAPSPAPAELRRPALAPAPAARLVTGTRLLVNLSDPARVEDVAAMDVEGVGLLRAELMMQTALDRAHPRQLIAEGRQEEFVARMVRQLSAFGRAFGHRPVTYRAHDFRTNEFRGMRGGAEFEPHEENPMIGYRGCWRYVREPELFALELRALAEARKGYPNLHLMIPFVRTLGEFRECRELVMRSPLGRDRSLQLWIMAEVPSVTYWLPEYAKLGIAGVSIGSNDLTQLVLGVDRDGSLVAPLFDERDPAVLDTIHRIVSECHRLEIKCSICGQAPSVYPDYAERLVEWGIDSVSVNPDVIDATRVSLAAAERRVLLRRAR